MTFGRLDHKPIVRPNPYGTLLFSRSVIPVFAFSRGKIIASAGFEWFRIKPLKITIEITRCIFLENLDKNLSSLGQRKVTSSWNRLGRFQVTVLFLYFFVLFSHSFSVRRLIRSRKTNGKSWNVSLFDEMLLMFNIR